MGVVSIYYAFSCVRPAEQYLFYSSPCTPFISIELLSLMCLHILSESTVLSTYCVYECQVNGSFQAWLSPTQDVFVHPQGTGADNDDPTVSYLDFSTRNLMYQLGMS